MMNKEARKEKIAAIVMESKNGSEEAFRRKTPPWTCPEERKNIGMRKQKRMNVMRRK